MLPVQVLWETSFKTSTVQIVALMLSAACEGKIFPHFSGHACCMLLTTSIVVKLSAMSSQNLYPYLPTMSFLFDHYVHVRTAIKSNINFNLRLHLVCKCNLFCTVPFDLKQYYIKTDIPPPPLLSHNAAFMNSEWNPEAGRGCILFLHFTTDKNLLLLFWVSIQIQN